MPIRIQCDSCQRGFQVPDSAVGKQARCPNCQSLIPIKQPQTSSAQASSAQQSPAKASTAALNQPATTNESILVSCSGCGKSLRAPARAAGKAIRCPSCQTTIPLPAVMASPQPKVPSQVNRASSVSPSSSPRSTLQDLPLGDDSLWASIPPANASVPYSGSSGYNDPYAVSTSSYSGGVSRGSSRASRAIQCKIIGVFMMIWAGLITLGCIIRPVIIGISLANLPQNVVIDNAKLAVLIGATAIGIVIALAVAFVLFRGGSAFFNQSNLSAAKSGAILTAIPCFGSCIFPIGIWACVLIYNERAKRDFDS